jgi:hypothetical protein
MHLICGGGRLTELAEGRVQGVGFDIRSVNTWGLLPERPNVETSSKLRPHVPCIRQPVAQEGPDLRFVPALLSSAARSCSVVGMFRTVKPVATH